MAQDQAPLVWIDMEMSGLVPERERILEVALVVTDSELNTLAEAPVLVVHQADSLLDAMDTWNKATHARSGLIEKVRASTLTEAEAEQRLIEFLKPIVAAGVAPLCGNTVHQDRRFMARYMPAFDAYLHYRIIDVSTLKARGPRGRLRVHRGTQALPAHVPKRRCASRRLVARPAARALHRAAPLRQPCARHFPGNARFEHAVARP